MDPTFSHQKAEQETFYYPTLYFLSFAEKLTFVEKISHTGPQENTLDLRPKKRHIGWKKQF